MDEWKRIEVKGIAKIERLVEEFEIWEFDKIPYGKFKVRVYESVEGKYTGRTNIMVIDNTNHFYIGVGKGNTVCEALKDTIRYFYMMIEEVDNLTNESFKYVDSIEF